MITLRKEDGFGRIKEKSSESDVMGKKKGYKRTQTKEKRGGFMGRKRVKRTIVLRPRPCPIKTKNFPDATRIEKELLACGTTKDKIDTLTLLAEREPTQKNYEGLLAFCKNQRNDVHYYALKNIKDLLISKKGVGDSCIEQNIVDAFSVSLKNEYIKGKVVELVYKLLEKDVLFLDFIRLFVDKLGDKKEMSGYVGQRLHLLSPKNEAVILKSVEDFYLKNDSFRPRHAALQFLARSDCKDKGRIFLVLNSILEHFDEEVPEEHRNILLEDLIMGLGKNITNESIRRIGLIRRAIHTEKMAFYGSKVLFATKDPEIICFFRNVIKSGRMRNSIYLPMFLNIVNESASQHRDEGFYGFLLDSSFLYTPQYIISVMMICSEAASFLQRKFDDAHSLKILSLHYHDVVRKLAQQLINGDMISPFDPFDEMCLVGTEMMCYEST